MKGFGFCREPSLIQRPRCKLFAEQWKEQKWGSGGVKRNKSMSQSIRNYVMELALSTGYCLYNPWQPWSCCLRGISAPTKVGRKEPTVLRCHPHHWAKVCPMDVYVARAWVPGTLLWWPPHTKSLRHLKTKARSTEWTWGGSWSAHLSEPADTAQNCT